MSAVQTGIRRRRGTASRAYLGTTQYGWNTSYWGQWELVGVDLQLSGKLSGTASIAIIFRRGGSDWAAVVETETGTWSMSN